MLIRLIQAYDARRLVRKAPALVRSPRLVAPAVLAVAVAIFRHFICNIIYL